MVSSGMLRNVALVGTDVSEELSASFIRVTRIGELATDMCCEEIPLHSMRWLLVTASVVSSSLILVTLMKEASLSSSETSYKNHTTSQKMSFFNIKSVHIY
jgi:hypothetical protein